MVAFTGSDDLRGARFRGVDLSGAHITASDLSRVVMRGVEIDGAEVDSPWLLEGGSLLVNGVDVAPFVDAELDRRFPGREQRRAPDPDGLRAAWAVLERTWADTVGRARAMPEGTVDVSVDGEWSFAQTLRHLIMATDTWLGRAVLARDRPDHPIGLANGEGPVDGEGTSAPEEDVPPFADVLEARAGRVDMVREYLAEVDAQTLDQRRHNPWAPEHAETVRSCLHTILEEEWEHHRYAVRDLDAIAAGAGVRPGS